MLDIELQSYRHTLRYNFLEETQYMEQKYQEKRKRNRINFKL